MRAAIIIFLTSLSLTAMALEDFDRQEIEKRIKPVGNVRLEKNATNAAEQKPAAEAVVAKKEPGQSIYEQYCSMCHRDGVAGAPKFRDEASWKPRLTAQKDVAGLTASAIKGINAMPPKGTCADCSEEDIKNAISYMLPRS